MNPVKSYTQAYLIRPHRSEPLYRLADYYERNDMPFLGVLVAQHALGIPFPENDSFFVEPWIYQWGNAAKLAECSSLLRNYDFAADLFAKILTLDLLPDETRKIIKNNLAHCLAKAPKK